MMRMSLLVYFCLLLVMSGNASLKRAKRKLADTECFDSIEWSTSDGNILVNGEIFHIRGANWPGFETDEYVVHGLWEGGRTVGQILDVLKENEVNALRVPVSLKLALNPEKKVTDGYCGTCDSDYSFDVMDEVFDEAATRGIVVLLDMHNLNTTNRNELWYDDDYTEDDFIQGWVNLMEYFGDKKNLMGIDVMNEPHGAATWGMGEDTDWDIASARIVKAIKKAYPSFNHLVLIEGIASGGAPSPYPETDPAYVKFWGANLDGLYTTQVDLGDELNNLLVYSTHIYGPSLYPMYYFYVDDFPDNMPEIWDKQLGFVRELTGQPLIVGEWGGQNVDEDAILQDAWTTYMAENNYGDAFIWSLSPDSDDIGGLMTDDWKDVQDDKMALVERSQPSPSLFTVSINDEVCVDPGEFSNGGYYSTADGLLTAITIKKVQFVM